MNFLPLIAVAAVPLWLAACATPAAPPAPAATAPPGWYAPLPHGGALSNLTQWWQQFNDPLLVQLIESAQTASPSIASARARIEQVRAARTAAGAALLPTFDGQASAARANTPPARLTTTLQAGMQAGWEIDLFGGNAQALRAAQSRLEAAQARWHDARVSVAAETANSYINLRTCDRLRSVAENDARSRAETARLADLTAQAGFTAPATAALARASAAEASVRTIQQAALCDIEVKVLVELSALPEPGLREQLAQAWQEPPQAALLPPLSLPAQLLAQRPDVHQAERDVAAASADVGSAQAQLYPRLSLSGSIAAGVVRIGGETAGAQTWSIGPLAVSLPLFDGGRRAANVDAARARYDEAVALYAARARLAVREVEQALVSLESSRLRLADARAASDGYRAVYLATEARYRSGLGSLVELEDARRSALVAQTQLVTLQREQLSAWIALYRAIGGGWARPDAPSA